MHAHLDGLGRLQRLLRRDSHLPLPQQLLGEVGDVSSCDGDVLDTAADNITFSLRGAEQSTEATSVISDEARDRGRGGSWGGQTSSFTAMSRFSKCVWAECPNVPGFYSPTASNVHFCAVPKVKRSRLLRLVH